jgi:hypothetical protein
MTGFFDVGPKKAIASDFAALHGLPSQPSLLTLPQETF